MTTHSSRAKEVATLLAALLLGAAPMASRAATAGEVFKAHEAEIATNRLVAVDGYVFGVGRALSRSGGDAVGFSKARLLAQGKIAGHAAGMAPWPDGLAPEVKALSMRLLEAEGLEMAGIETVVERREAPEHYMAVAAVAEPALRRALPSRERLAALAAKARARLEEPRQPSDAIEEYEPRGYWEEGGVKANETMVEAQFL